LIKKQKAHTVHGDQIQDSIVVKHTAIDEIRRRFEDEGIESVLNLLKEQNNYIGTHHPLYPNFILDFKEVNGQKVPYSKPSTKAVQKDYTPNFKGKMKLSEKYSDFKNFKELLDYSYQTQTDIEINVVELKKMLGDIDDPYQQEIDAMLAGVEGQWFIKHKEFPPAMPYKIVLEGIDFTLDYVLLRTCRIEDSVVYLSNKEQNSEFKIEIELNVKNSSMTFNFGLNENYKYNYNSQLRFLSLSKALVQKCYMRVISLDFNMDFIAGEIDNYNYESSFNDIDAEIEFIGNVILVEDTFNKKIIVPSEIMENDYTNLFYLAKGIKGEELSGEWDSLNANLEINENGIKFWDDKPQDAICLTLVQYGKTISVFGVDFYIPKSQYTFLEAKLVDKEKVYSKISYLDIGDSIKVNFIPGANRKYVESFDIIDFNKDEE